MRSILIVCGLVTCASPASAQWDVTVFLGDAATSPGRLEIRSAASDTSVAVEPVRFGDESSASPWYYGARLTWRPNRVPWLGVEAEFIHAKAIADPAQLVQVRGRLDGVLVDGDWRLGTILPRFELSHGLNFLLGNAVIYWPIASRKADTLVEIVGRLGLGLTMPHVESSFDGHEEDAYQLGGRAVDAAIGSQIRVWRHVSAIVEFKMTRTRQRVDVGAANVEGVFTTRHVVAGIVWRTAPVRHQPFIR